MGKAEEVVPKIASQVQLNKLKGDTTLHVMPILFRNDRLEAKKRRKQRKRWADFVKAKRAKHLIVRAV